MSLKQYVRLTTVLLALKSISKCILALGSGITRVVRGSQQGSHHDWAKIIPKGEF